MSKMEDFERTQSTATSGTFDSKTGFKTVKKTKTIGYENESPCKFEEHLKNQNGEKKYNQYLQLSGKTNALALELQRLHQLHNVRSKITQRMSQSTTIAEAEQFNLNKYAQVSRCNAEAEKDLKLKISSIFAKTDKQISDLFRIRTNFIKDTDRIIKDQLQQLSEQKQATFSVVSKFSKNKLQELSNKAALLRKETLTHKKENANFREELFGILNAVRSKLGSQVSEQEARRKAYDEIIQNLLEKSCVKAEQAMRRKLY